MTRMIGAALTVAILVLPAAPAVCADETALHGIYLSTGQNPDGSEYHGVVRITRHGDSFVVLWLFAELVEGHIVLVPSGAGVGILEAGTFAVSYYTALMSGIVSYRVEEDGTRLVGRWVVAGTDGASHAETLTKVPVETEDAPATPPAERPTPQQPGAGARSAGVKI